MVAASELRDLALSTRLARLLGLPLGPSTGMLGFTKFFHTPNRVSDPALQGKACWRLFARFGCWAFSAKPVIVCSIWLRHRRHPSVHPVWEAEWLDFFPRLSRSSGHSASLVPNGSESLLLQCGTRNAFQGARAGRMEHGPRKIFLPRYSS